MTKGFPSSSYKHENVSHKLYQVSDLFDFHTHLLIWLVLILFFLLIVSLWYKSVIWPHIYLVVFPAPLQNKTSIKWTYTVTVKLLHVNFIKVNITYTVTVKLLHVNFIRVNITHIFLLVFFISLYYYTIM